MEVLKTFFAADGTKLGYFGPKNPKADASSILLLHGMASNATRWSEFVANTHLHETGNLYRMDLRGRQHSLYLGSYTRRDWLQDIKAFMQHENISRLLFIGHSMGAQIAQDFACNFPAQCRGIILIDPVFPSNLHGQLKLVQRFKWLAWSLLQFALLFNRLGLHRRDYPHRDLHQLDKDTRAFLAANPQSTISDLYMSPTADLKHIPTSSYLQDLLSVVAPICPQEDVSCPVRVLLSAGASVSNYTENLSSIELFPDHKIDIIQADHWLLTEQPDEARLALEKRAYEIINTTL
ncbi:MAG: alpha/beta hydrolase [Gammaproteobacteria bacterium]|nr:alpha/beta hydrolase [Gammaproteobacteria bacterium]